MGYQKLQVGRATDMTRLRSDTENLVNLYDVIATGTLQATSTSGLVDSGDIGFLDNNIQPGDIVINTSTALAVPLPTPVASRIVSILDNRQAQLQTDIALVNLDNITVLKQSSEPGVLYVGTSAAGNALQVTTMGGDTPVFSTPIQGTFLPVQVKGVFQTSTVEDILALF